MDKMDLLIYSSIFFLISLVLIPAISGVLMLLPYVLEATSEDIHLALQAVLNSLIVASIVTSIDIFTGIPLAWLIARKENEIGKTINFFLDAPLFMPTAALGFSVLSFWSVGELSLKIVSPGFMLVLFLHFTFTYPYVVRTLVGVIKSTDFSTEIAARSMGIKGLPLLRTISIPLIKPGIAASILLSFARSVSETGATYVVAGSFETGPVFIKNHGLLPSSAIVVITLISISLIFFAISEKIFQRRILPLYPIKSIEKKLGKKSENISYTVAILFLLTFIMIPSFYFVAYLDLKTSYDLGSLVNSIFLSIFIAGLATLSCLLFGIPLAYYLAREFGSIRDAISSILMIPIIIPTVSLGLSLRVFWRTLGLPALPTVILAHLSFTFPLFVVSYTASIKSIDPELEHVSRSLGASKVKTFRKITLPLTKNGIIAASIIAFTRSFGETGATIAVSEEVKTVPLLLVDWIKSAQSGLISFSQVALGTFITIIIGLLLLAVVKKFGTETEVS